MKRKRATTWEDACEQIRRRQTVDPTLFPLLAAEARTRGIHGIPPGPRLCQELWRKVRARPNEIREWPYWNTLPPELRDLVLMHALSSDPIGLARLCLSNTETRDLCEATRIHLQGIGCDTVVLNVLQAAKLAAAIGSSDPRHLCIAHASRRCWLVALLDWLIQRGAVAKVNGQARTKALALGAEEYPQMFGDLEVQPPISFTRDIAEIPLEQLPLDELENLLAAPEIVMGTGEAPVIRKLFGPWIDRWHSKARSISEGPWQIRTEDPSTGYYGVARVYGSQNRGLANRLATFEVSDILRLAGVTKSYGRVGVAFADNIGLLESETFRVILETWLNRDIARYLQCPFDYVLPLFSLYSGDFYIRGTYPRSGMLLGSFRRIE